MSAERAIRRKTAGRRVLNGDICDHCGGQFRVAQVTIHNAQEQRQMFMCLNCLTNPEATWRRRFDPPRRVAEIIARLER